MSLMLIGMFQIKWEMQRMNVRIIKHFHSPFEFKKALANKRGKYFPWSYFIFLCMTKPFSFSFIIFYISIFKNCKVYSRSHKLKNLSVHVGVDEGTEGKLRTKQKLTPLPTPQMGYMWHSSYTPRCPKAKEKENK